MGFWLFSLAMYFFEENCSSTFSQLLCKKFQPSILHLSYSSEVGFATYYSLPESANHWPFGIEEYQGQNFPRLKTLVASEFLAVKAESD